MVFTPTGLEPHSVSIQGWGILMMEEERDSESRMRRNTEGEEHQRHRKKSEGDRQRADWEHDRLPGGRCDLPKQQSTVTSNTVLMRLHGEDKNKL